MFYYLVHRFGYMLAWFVNGKFKFKLSQDRQLLPFSNTLPSILIFVLENKDNKIYLLKEHDKKHATINFKSLLSYRWNKVSTTSSNAEVLLWYVNLCIFSKTIINELYISYQQ